jgi:hypothetical protein
VRERERERDREEFLDKCVEEGEQGKKTESATSDYANGIVYCILIEWLSLALSLT